MNYKKTLNILLIILVCFMPLIYVPSGYTNINSNLIKAIVIYIITTILIFLCYKIKYSKPDIADIVLILFYLFNIISLIFSMKFSISLTGLVSSHRYDGVIMLGCYIIIYYCAKYYFDISKNFLKIFVCSGLLVCLIGIYQFVTFNQTNTLLPYTESVLKSTIGNSNFVGSYLVLFLPTLITLYFLKGKWQYLLLSSVFCLTLILSTARSAWVGMFAFVIILFAFLIKNFKKSQIKSYLIIITLLVIFCISAIIFEKVSGNHILSFKIKSLFQDILSLKNGISEEIGTARIKIWKMVIDVIKSKPLLGTGPETLPYGLAKYSSAGFFRWVFESNTFIDKAHNDYLQIAACCGIPALVLYLIFLFFALKNNLKNIFKNAISFILVGTLIAYLVQAFFNINVVSVTPIFWFILGISQNNKAKENLQKYFMD